MSTEHRHASTSQSTLVGTDDGVAVPGRRREQGTLGSRASSGRADSLVEEAFFLVILLAPFVPSFSEKTDQSSDLFLFGDN